MQSLGGFVAVVPIIIACAREHEDFFAPKVIPILIVF